MSDDTRPPELQFEHAETPGSGSGAPPAGAPHCAVCQLEIVGSYWEHHGRMLCEACRDKLVDSWQRGSGFGRFARATFFGLIAAAAGTLVYWAIAELTGYEFSLIALLIGFAVGGAVKYGSRGRGGWRYQALAIFLTYTSIVSTYVPALWQAIKQQEAPASVDDAASEASSASKAEAPLPPGLRVREAVPVDPTPATPLVVEPESAVPAAEPEAEPPSPEAEPESPTAAAESGIESEAPSMAGCFAGVLALIGFLYAAPFLAGFENFIGWIILAIGLYEAWKMNRPEDREVRGPFAVGGSALPNPAPPPATPG